MSVNFVLLANSTTSNEMLDKGGKAWPPEVVFQDRFSAEDFHVAQEGGRVDRVEEGRAGRGGNVHPLAKVKMAIVHRPVQKSGVSEQGDPSSKAARALGTERSEAEEDWM